MSGTETYQDIDYDDAPAAPVNALALQPSRLPMSPSIAKEFDIDAPTWRVLVEQTFPAARTIEAVLMALSYCRARNLDIFKKPVHIVPMWSSAKRAMVETVWPGIAEIRTTAARTGEYAGIDEVEFGPMVDRDFTGTLEQWENRKKVTKTITKKVRFPEWARVTVYRITKGQRFGYHAKVFWEETYAKMGRTEIPNEMWEKRARGQLDKCVEAAALRKAFPEEVGSMYAAEEMEGRVIDATPVIAAPEPPRPPTPPSPPAEDEPHPSVSAESEVADEINAADFDNTKAQIDAMIPATMPKDSYFLRIDEELADLSTEDEVIAHYETLGVDAALAGNDEALDRAAAIRNHHMARVNGQGDLLAERPFPLDVPLTKAQKLAGTP